MTTRQPRPQQNQADKLFNWHGRDRQLIAELRAEVADLRIDLDVISADRHWLVATLAGLAVDVSRLMEGGER